MPGITGFLDSLFFTPVRFMVGMTSEKVHTVTLQAPLPPAATSQNIPNGALFHRNNWELHHRTIKGGANNGKIAYRYASPYSTQRAVVLTALAVGGGVAGLYFGKLKPDAEADKNRAVEDAKNQTAEDVKKNLTEKEINPLKQKVKDQDKSIGDLQKQIDQLRNSPAAVRPNTASAVTPRRAA